MARQEQKLVDVAVAGAGLAELAIARTLPARWEVLEALDAIGGR
jgi:predicted NAD/FAD-binding protein